MNNLITIDLSSLDKEKPTGLILAKDGTLAKEAETELSKILETRELLDKILDYVKERLGEEMDKKKLIKVKGGSITVSKRAFGGRYKLGLNPAVEFIVPVVYNKVNSEAIDNYVAEKGDLPQGIELREREAKVSILKRNEDSD